MDKEKLQRYFKYAILGSLIVSFGSLLMFILGAKNITCCNFINSLKCGDEEKED